MTNKIEVNNQEILTKLAKELIDLTGISCEIEVEEKEEEVFEVNLKTEGEAGLLIGFRGENINAIQTILNLMYKGKTDNWIRVLVNVGDYRQKQEDKLKIEVSVGKLKKYECGLGHVDEKILKNFDLKIDKHRVNIKRLLLGIKKSGSRIVGYGAGGRANTFLSTCGIGNDILDYIVDESLERQGRFTPGTHIPIVSPEIFRKDSVKYVLLLAWNYKKEIIKKERAFVKNGGKFIVSFPGISMT